MQAADKLAAGGAYADREGGYVFADEVGRPLDPTFVSKAVGSLMKAAKIKGATLHSTRHTAATAMISGGADLQSTAAVLGHSSPTITLMIYSHEVAGATRAAVDVLSAQLESAAGGKGR